MALKSLSLNIVVVGTLEHKQQVIVVCHEETAPCCQVKCAGESAISLKAGSLLLCHQPIGSCWRAVMPRGQLHNPLALQVCVHWNR